MANDKPFECTEPGCGMSFANEDHLSVHQAKHAMSLALTSGSARPGCILTFVADQTPTPTKFLRNCEEMGLFHELTKNPFEEAFKKAAEENKSLDLHEQSSPFPVASIDTESLHVDHVVGSLNTPIPISLDSAMQSMVNVKSNLTSINSVNIIKSTAFNPLPGPDAEIGSTLGSTPSPACTQSQVTAQISDESSEAANQNQIEMLPVSVSDAVGCRSLTGEAKHCENETSPGVYFFQWYSTPEGESVPVAMHVASNDFNSIDNSIEVSSGQSSVPTNALCLLESNSSDSSTTATTINGVLPSQTAVPKILTVQRSTAYTAATSSGIASTTKERLKAAIQQNSQANLLHSNMKVMSDAVEWITANQSRSAAVTSAQQHLPFISDSPADAVSSATGSGPATVLLRISDQQIQFEDVDTSTPKKLRLSSSDDDSDVRRQRFLERNREAAARCRMKKKYWMTNLEHRSEEVEKVNHSLQVEVTKLRQQVAQLKTMLLAHTDCPVTQRQRLLLAESHVSEPEDDEAIAMAALSTLADSGVHLTEDQLMLISQHAVNDPTNCAVAVDLSSSNSVC